MPKRQIKRQGRPKTVAINQALHQKLKLSAVMRNIGVGELLERIIRQHLQKRH